MFGEHRGNRTHRPVLAAEAQPLGLSDSSIVSLQVCVGQRASFAVLTELGEVFVYSGAGLTKISTLPCHARSLASGFGFLAIVGNDGFIWTAATGKDSCADSRLGWKANPSKQDPKNHMKRSNMNQENDEDRIEFQKVALPEAISGRVGAFGLEFLDVSCGNAHTLAVSPGATYTFGRKVFGEGNFSHADHHNNIHNVKNDDLEAVFHGQVLKVWAGPQNCFVQVGPTGIFGDLTKALNTDLLSDCLIQAKNGEKIPAHRVVLSCAIKDGFFVCKNNGEIEVDAPARGVQGVLAILYAGAVSHHDQSPGFVPTAWVPDIKCNFFLKKIEKK